MCTDGDGGAGVGGVFVGVELFYGGAVTMVWVGSVLEEWVVGEGVCG